jgi:hypothetical protein
MNTLSQLIAGLQAEYNPDYWSDNIKTDMGLLIDQLEEAEWTELTKIWNERPTDWQAKLAEAAFLSDQPKVIPMLISMLGTDSPAVGAAVARTLTEKQYFWDPAVDLVPDIKRLLGTATENEKRDLMALLNRLPH